ncbi:addiction module toxin, RelE/StbE family [Thiovulum sp. ES]|nr:addiction module toxin, RelE/StbE family [Thiovulum sp. ES]
MFDFQIAETKTFQKNKKKIDESVLRKIEKIVYPQLRSNPFYGTNIKKLKGEFEKLYRYRVGDYRLFYSIENEKVLVMILDLRHRQNSYS